MRRPHSRELVLAMCMAASVLTAGCETLQDWFKTDENRWLDASQMVRRPTRQRMALIQSGISPADDRRELPPTGTPPTEEDATYREEEYVIGPADILDITVMDLLYVGVETQLRREVTDAGYIDLPVLPERIKAKGLTQDQLKGAIVAAYRKHNVLKDAVVSVSVVFRRQNLFTVLGAVLRSGTFNIVRKDMRMLEALGLAGDVLSPTCRYIILIRPAPAIVQPSAEANAEAAPPGAVEPLGPLPQPLAPGVIPTSASVPATQNELNDLRKLVPGAGNAPAPPSPAPPSPSVVPRLSQASAGPMTAGGGEGARTAPANGARWTYDESRRQWIRVEDGSGEAVPPTLPERAPSTARGPATPLATQAEDANVSPFEIWRRKEKAEGSRVIVINYRSLVNGDVRSNVVIRDNDVIYVPRDVTGEFYVMGEVQRPGVYSLTGRNITVKMAIAAAGNLSPTAWPTNSILIRRIGDNQEQVIPLDVEAIFHGRSTDLFLKPDDVIAVGSSWRQPFLAIFRNAFRFSYGFGFVYDRNFGSPAYGSAGLDSRRFTRW